MGDIDIDRAGVREEEEEEERTEDEDEIENPVGPSETGFDEDEAEMDEEEEGDEFDEYCFETTDQINEAVKRERHEAYLKKVKAVRNEWECILEDTSATNERKIIKTIGNLEETRVVLEEYMLVLADKGMKVEEQEIHQVCDEVIAMKMQLENYLEIEKVTVEEEEENQKCISQILKDEEEQIEKNLIANHEFKDHVKPIDGVSSNSTNASNQPVVSQTYFAPRIVVMEIVGIEYLSDTLLGRDGEPTDHWTLHLKDDRGCIWQCFLSNMRFTEDFGDGLGVKILVLANAQGGRKYPLTIRRKQEKSLVEVPASVPLGKVACLVGYDCDSNDKIEITRKEWERYLFNTTTMLKAFNAELILLDCPDGTGLNQHSVIRVSPAWHFCVVDVDWIECFTP